MRRGMRVLWRCRIGGISICDGCSEGGGAEVEEVSERFQWLGANVLCSAREGQWLISERGHWT
jgi:hypothetical protein